MWLVRFFVYEILQELTRDHNLMSRVLYGYDEE